MNLFNWKGRLLTSSILTAVILIVYAASVAISAVSTSSVVAKLRSPRQIDRTPVLEEKIQQACKDIQALLKDDDEEIRQAYVALLCSKNRSKLIRSFREQTLNWIAAKKADPEGEGFQYPLSTKQFAWALYILYPGKYINPKQDPAIYPELHGGQQ